MNKHRWVHSILQIRGNQIQNVLCLILLCAILIGCHSRERAIRKDAENMPFGEAVYNYKGILIHYSDTGQGQPFILLHGFGGSSYSWRYLAPFFSRRYRVISIDLKGFGRSDKPLDDEYSLGDQCAIIKTFIMENDLKDVILGGHSFGGAVALMTFLDLQKEKPNPIAKLIVIDSPSYDQRISGFALLRTPILNKMMLSILPHELMVKFALRKSFHDDSKISKESIRIYASYLNHPGSHHALIETAKRNIPHNSNGIVSNLKDINVPLLLIWGEKDKIIPLSSGEKLSRIIPKSTFAVIPNCGHIPQEEYPQETIEIISQFLEASR